MTTLEISIICLTIILCIRQICKTTEYNKMSEVDIEESKERQLRIQNNEDI